MADGLKRVGSDISAADWWNRRSKKDAEGMASAYHTHRLRVIRSILPPLEKQRVLDFGCGNGEMLRYASINGAHEIIGIEPNAHFASIARNAPKASVLAGGVEHLI